MSKTSRKPKSKNQKTKTIPQHSSPQKVGMATIVLCFRFFVFPKFWLFFGFPIASDIEVAFRCTDNSGKCMSHTDKEPSGRFLCKRPGKTALSRSFWKKSQGLLKTGQEGQEGLCVDVSPGEGPGDPDRLGEAHAALGGQATEAQGQSVKRGSKRRKVGCREPPFSLK